MGGAVRIGIFTLFCAVLFLVSQRAESAPLAYVAFFPLGFLVVFYFFDSKEWFLFTLSAVLLILTHFFRSPGLLAEETTGLGGATVGCFLFLIYHRTTWAQMMKDEDERCGKIGTELEDLKQKHTTRVESLLHLEKQVASLINLFEVAREFNEYLDLKETVQILYKKVLPELPFERAELILPTPDKDHPAVARIYIISSQGVEERVPIATEAVEQEWLLKMHQEKNYVIQNDLWLFPLITEGEFNALFAIQGALKEDLSKLEVLASQLALQVRKVRLYEMVRELSIIDGLTGVFVRRHFLERFEEEIRRALKHNFPLSVLMLDIDHFKRYNDEFGHLVGDATLREVVQIIRSNVRNVDIVARYGGEEFVVVIPETREEGAVEVAERIRSAVARHSFRVYDEETKATVSIGISVFPQDLSEPSASGYDPNFLFELLQKADRTLYRAKEEGRNRVVVYRSLGRG